MRGDIIERCLIFLLKLPDIRVPTEFPTTVVSVMEWANETIVGLLCLVLLKFNVKYTPVQVLSNIYILLNILHLLHICIENLFSSKMKLIIITDIRHLIETFISLLSI